MARRKNYQVGDVFEINLGDLGMAYAVAVYGNELCFLNILSKSSIIPSSEDLSNFLFRVPVASDELKSQKWVMVGKLPVPENMSKPGTYAKRDIGTESFSLYCNGNFSPTSRGVALGYEVAAVWFTDHVEERLISHFNGEQSLYLTGLRNNNGLF